MIIEKINILIGLYKDDTDVLDIINDMSKSCRRYFETIIQQSESYVIHKHRLCDDDFKELIKRTQEVRSLTHNAMCHLIKICNRLAKEKGMTDFYTGENHRLDYAAFAKQLCIEYFDMKIHNIDEELIEK